MLDVSQETARPIVKALFVSSGLLSIVSFYTTQQGMALYLSPWMSIVAALGIQTALLLVAWMVGFTRTRRALLIAVYSITAVVSIAFSYASLYGWFTARERPAQAQRRLYDELIALAARADETLAAAGAEARKHALALEEMTAAEKAHGFIAAARDADPHLDQIRAAVAREAQTYSGSYREGSGAGLRYTAFERYAKLERQSLAQLEEARRSVASFRSALKPDAPTEQQLRQFHAAFDSVPWGIAEQTLHQGKIERAAAPAYAANLERSASGQEELLVSFRELIASPGPAHAFALALAAFMDIVIFLLAYASGPFFFGSPEQRWAAASATIDSADTQVFLRDFLRKMTGGPRGLPRVDESMLTAGERHFCLLLASQGLAAVQTEDGRRFYALDEDVHGRLVESLSSAGINLRASAAMNRA
jgi:hypothetical protein